MPVQFCRICPNVVAAGNEHLGTCDPHTAAWRASEEFKRWRARLREDAEHPAASYRGWLKAFLDRVQAELAP